MDKNFPASEVKLFNLRQAGIFPKSNFIQRFFKALIFAFTIFNVVPYFLKVEDFKLLYQIDDVKFKLDFFLNLLAKLTIILVLSLSISNLLGFFQTKFFFSFDLIKAGFHKFSLADKGIIYQIIILFILVFAVSVLFYENLKYFLEPTLTYAKFIELLFAQVLLLLACLMFFGVVSYMLNWFLFRKQHMMSREELEAEYREQQARKIK